MVSSAPLTAAHHSKNAYVVCESEEMAKKALEVNGTVLNGLTLRVSLAGNTTVNKKKSVFVGGLPYQIEEEELRTLFSDKGANKVTNIRLVRDSMTGLGKVHKSFNAQGNRLHCV